MTILATAALFVLYGLIYIDLYDAFVCPGFDEHADDDEDSDFPGPIVTARNGTPTT